MWASGPCVRATTAELARENAYSSNMNFSGDILGGIDIDLVKLDRIELFRQSFEDGADCPAGTTPSCPKVKDGDLVPVDLIRD